MTAAARAMAAMKFRTLRSKRVRMRRRSLRRQNMLFNGVALLVGCLVVLVLDLAVLARRDDGFGAALLQPFAQFLAVIAFVGDEFAPPIHNI